MECNVRFFKSPGRTQCRAILGKRRLNTLEIRGRGMAGRIPNDADLEEYACALKLPQAARLRHETIHRPPHRVDDDVARRFLHPGPLACAQVQQTHAL